ncbi:2Fe-2S iron-sulfur cluster binding domain-containing protein, partial [Wenyingzhuangia sp. 1_MG-2023]|nr:2Fe-2S iron-sulfur cluster binding domain-containing protein [Wenyingzhuangia sp. 1_MG-2023]
LELHKTGETINVGKDETILDCVRKVRQGLSFSCSDGYCGTCETAVLGGIPDHRDTVLSEQEREENRTMMICVSRSKTRKLILDL